MSTLKVSNIQDISNNAAMSISGGVTTFSNLPVNASAAGSAAFMARITGDGQAWATVGDGGILPFDDVSTGDNFDTDSCYNTSTYKYTAPATGVYTFWFSIYTANTGDTNGFSFLKNSTRLNTQTNGNNPLSFVSAESGDHQQSVSIIIPLSSGDTIAAMAAYASDYYTGHCQWGGCRLV